MARALLVAALGAPLLAWSWMSLESGHDAGQATLVVVLAIAAALVRPRWARVAACLAALLVAGAIAFGVGHVWALPARMLSRFGNGFLEFYDYQVPFDPATHPRMHGVLLLALFAFTLAFALAVAARRPALAAMALVVGVGWPGTLLPGHDLLRGTMLLVAVLGTVVSDTLFGPDVDSTGQIIRVRNQPFKVIGVMSAKGQSGMGPDMDDQILVPYTTVMKKLLGVTNIRDVTVSAATAGETGSVADAIAVVLRTRHRIVPGQDDDFTVRTAEEIADIRTQAMGTMTTLLAGIAGVSLIVGGIGIMNIMLVSVTERTREIGLRMAIGAKGRDVLLQFLVEAIALSLLGGGIGIALGFGLAEGMSRWMSWPAKVPVNAVAMAFGFAAAVGVFFGFYPAQKAARLDPIDALRFE